MSIIAVRSIGLSRETRDGWHRAGMRFTLRDRTMHAIPQIAGGYLHVLNLGNSNFPDPHDFPPDVTVWNPSNVVNALIPPATARRVLGDLMPPQPTTFPCYAWIKGPGRKGGNKSLVEFQGAGIPMGWDVQAHIDGVEYRVITVRDKVVQVHKRTDNDESERQYAWTGIGGTPWPVKKVAKLGAAKLPWPHTVIGWDIMHDEENDKAYILEGNTCPGVNTPTAERIMNAMLKEGDEDAE